MAWTGSLRKAAIGAGVLALHALFVAVLIHAGVSIPAPASAPERETLLTFVPLPPPPKPAEKKPRAPAASSSITITLPRVFAVPPVSNAPSSALQGLGAALGCSASNYDTLGEAQRAACGRGPWQFDGQAHETASLMIAPSPHRMTPVEIAEHIRRTEDPCLAEKAAHLPFCVYRIIYGDKLP